MAIGVMMERDGPVGDGVIGSAAQAVVALPWADAGGRGVGEGGRLGRGHVAGRQGGRWGADLRLPTAKSYV